MNRPGTVHVLVPSAIADLTLPSGGNTYDVRLCDGLTDAGWSVQPRLTPGGWPWADADDHEALDASLRALPDGALVLVDGIIASNAPEVLGPASRRLRLVVLLHMPLSARAQDCRPREGAVLSAAAAVVTPSRWCRDWVLEAYGLDPARVHVVEPGVDSVDVLSGGVGGGNLLSVGAVIPDKGHDLLLAALVRIADLEWRCQCVGTLARAPEFVDTLRRTARASGLEERFELVGPRTGAELDASYAAADVLVLATRAESYGMVVTEALARGRPVLATEVGGVPEALGRTPDGRRPGLLVPPEDVVALAEALRLWLCEPDVRQALRRATWERRARLTGWSETADRVARVLEQVAA